TILLPKIDVDAAPFVDRYDVQEPGSIEVRHFGHPNLRIRWAEGDPFETRKVGVRTVEIQVTLAAIPIRNRQIDEPVVIEVSRSDCGCGFVGEGNAVGVEASFPHV